MNGDDGAACLSLVLIVVRFLLGYPQFHKGAGETSRLRCLPRPLAHERLQKPARGGSLSPHSDLIVSKSGLPQCIYSPFRERGVSKDADRERIFSRCHKLFPLSRGIERHTQQRGSGETLHQAASPMCVPATATALARQYRSPRWSYRPCYRCAPLRGERCR